MKAQCCKQENYINELQKMNELQQKETHMLRSKLYRLEEDAVKEIELMNNKVTDNKIMKQKSLEKVISQVMQLGSAAIHLKDLIKLAEVGAGAHHEKKGA